MSGLGVSGLGVSGLGLIPLALAILVFLGSHSLTNRPGFRRRAEAALGGRRPFTIAYSLLSVALLAGVIAAYGEAPYVPLWGQEPWMRWVPALVMIPACLLMGSGMATANPFSIGPGGGGYDPARPGLLRLTRHPVLWGLALWAGAHGVPNGDVAALMVFVPLLALALAGPRLLDAKRRRVLPDWESLAAATARPRWSLVTETGWRWLVGVALYGLLFALHLPVIGASPWP